MIAVISKVIRNVSVEKLLNFKHEFGQFNTVKQPAIAEVACPVCSRCSFNVYQLAFAGPEKTFLERCEND